MVGRLRIGSRIVILVTVASTLLTTRMPLGRVCACEPASLPAIANVQPNAVSEAAPASSCTCPCCRNLPDSDDEPKACCLAKQTVGLVGPNSEVDEECLCRVKSLPIAPDPSAPPRSTDLESNKGLTSTAAAAGYVDTRPPVGPAHVKRANCSLAPPPIDLVISLSRWTC